jgi:hypothetical protein
MDLDALANDQILDLVFPSVTFGPRSCSDNFISFWGNWGLPHGQVDPTLQPQGWGTPFQEVDLARASRSGPSVNPVHFASWPGSSGFRGFLHDIQSSPDALSKWASCEKKASCCTRDVKSINPGGRPRMFPSIPLPVLSYSFSFGLEALL